MPSTEKEIMYQEVVDRMKDKPIFFSSFDGVTVQQMEEFRGEIRKQSGRTFVAKKTLVRRFFSDLGIQELDSVFEQKHCLLTTIEEEPQKVSKVLVKYEKDLEDKFFNRGIFIDGELRDKKFVVSLSKLPSREQLIASMMGSMKAPVNNFVLTLNQVVRSFTVVLNEIKKQKEEQGEAAPAAEEAPKEEPKAEEAAPTEEPKTEEAPKEEPKAEETPKEEPKAEDKPEESEEK